MNTNFEQIKSYFNIGLVVVFILIVVGVAIAALRGLRRGVWKSTHNMVFMLSLIIIAFITLDPLCKFVENFDIGKYWHATIMLSQARDGGQVIYYVPVTTIKETATEFLKGMYMLFNVSASASSASNFAFAIVESLIKIVLFIVDMILIVTLGNLLSFITWFAVSQHFVPKIARKVVKIRWLGAIETAATYLVLTVLFMTPFTSILNSLNQSYQKNKPQSDNEIVMNIGNFVNAYNDSLFAKVLFNWTVDKDGMTIDTKLFSTFTTGISEDVTVNLANELGNLTNLIVIASEGATQSEDGSFAFDAMRLVYKDTIDSMFGILGKSNLISNILPIAAEIALNSELIEGAFPARLLNISDVEWKKELSYVQEMVDSLFDSGFMDALISTDAQGNRKFRSFEGQDLYDFLDAVLHNKDFDQILNIFKAMDDSKILCRIIPALIYMFEQQDTTGQMKQFLPFSWEELNEFSWGFELYVLFDFLHQTITVDRDFLKAFLIQTEAYKPEEGEEYTKLSTIISRNLDNFNKLIVGEFGTDGKLKNSDKYGRTVVFDKGKRIEGRNYCLFDMKLFELALPTVIDGLFQLDFMKDYKSSINEDDELSYHNAVEDLTKGVVLTNFKKEFNSILGILGTLAKDESLVDVVFGAEITTLMTEEGNFFSIKESTIKVFQQAIEKMNQSTLLYAGIVPVIKNLISSEDMSNTFKDLGMRTDVLVSAINQDSKKKPEQREFFSSLASILDFWGAFGRLFSAVKNSSSDIMSSFKDDSLVNDLVSLLTTVIENPILNPSPATGDTFVKNENLYGLLEYVFAQTGDIGFTVTRETLEKVESPGHTWSDEINALGNIIKFIAKHDVTKASDLFKDGLTRSAISDLKDENKIGLPKLFTLIDKSYIFSSSLGPFLDTLLGDSLSGFLIDKGHQVSFSNITNWTSEGQNISNLLDSLYNLIPADDAQAKDFLSNFDMSNLHDIVELNDMLHQLSNSGIFTYIDENNVKHYQFGAWFYQKINDAMMKFSVNENSYDLLADPKPGEDASWTWKDSWGIKPGSGSTPDPYFQEYQNEYNKDGTQVDTHMIAYRDFVYLEGLANTDDTLPTKWCDYKRFTVEQAAFLAAHKADLTNNNGPYLKEESNYWGEYFASDKFIEEYNDVFECDEIGKVCKFMTYSMRVLEKTTKGPYAGNQVPFNKLPIPLVEGLLVSINETSSLRVCLYNFYRVAAENLLNGYSAFNLSTAYNIYMIDANYGMFDYANARSARQAELDKLIDFYKIIDKAQEKGIIVDNNFVYSKLNQDGFIEDMKKGIKDLSDSYVFHRLGASKVNSLTTFQGMFDSMLSQSSIKDTIYLGDKSPKDSNATNYDSQASKIRYLVTKSFLTDQQIADQSLNQAEQINKQHGEIDKLLDSVDALYSLKDKDGNSVTDINAVDMNKSDNIDIIETLFNNMNESELMKDCLPNTIYKIFIENDQFNIESGGKKVDFKLVDPFYHYYFADTVARSQVDYEAVYIKTKDIAGIKQLLIDYQELNTQLAGKDMSDPQTLKGLTAPGGALESVLMDMHNSNLFHSPARQGRYGSLTYYTNKYQTGYTLFEEMMDTICSSVGLDTFAYDNAYDSEANASTKLQNHIFALTKADDGQTNAGDAFKPYYHKAHNAAWSQEVNSVMHLANVTSNLATGSSLDVSSFELDKLDPIDIKNVLAAVNGSDLVSDALPKFVKDGFASINLGTLTTYNAIDYSYYRLGQEAYGGTDNSAPEGSEIDNVYQVMLSLYKEGTPKYHTNMNNLNEFVQGAEGETRLTGLLRYVYKSRILNTSREGGVYDELNTLATGQKISAQGVMLYNSLGNDLAAYVARDANPATAARGEADKIATLTKLVHMHNYFEAENDITYIVEAKGLKRLIDLTDGQITADTFSDNNVETIKAKKALILSIVESAYNATNEAEAENYKRSAITSEFVSGLFNYILENQYTKLTNTKPTYQYVTYSFGNADAATLALADYASLNVVERNGLEGMLDALSYISANPSAMKANSAAIKDCFAKMGAETGKNSHLAQALYLTEAHQYIAMIRNPLILNSGEMFVPTDETTCDPAVDNNIYSNTFSFKAYGEYIHEFLSGATIVI